MKAILPDTVKPPTGIFWRISKHADLSGAGGKIVDGRWHTKGLPIVYLAESHAGALLESLVHLEFSGRRLPESYTLLKIEVPDLTDIPLLEPSAEDWRDQIEVTQAMGNHWLAESTSPVIRVPSSVVSETWNVLLNPLHPQSQGARIVLTRSEKFDIRLFRSRTGHEAQGAVS